MPVLVKVVAVADTHGYQSELNVPDGDIFIHAGDLSQIGTVGQLEEAATWIRGLPHKEKIIIAGNHDWLFQREPAVAREIFDEFHYLEDSALELLGIKFWGSPWQPEFFNWAFNLPRGEALADVWSKIPSATDVLITHGPPMGYGDKVYDGRREGCADLLRVVTTRVKPALHVFGHIHEDHGNWRVDETLIANVTTNEGDIAPSVFHLVNDAGTWHAEWVE